ncbi:hypothetical protein [Paenibacillus sp. Y412MC10]|uniref:hypothetical protein n=1 Tax=Geobacillus sp. (strain Y412MC10) TaxID=481743 RepID=UPI001C93137E|nr:hypothetical protein [Paenibacillus sp. Y412MC10]
MVKFRGEVKLDDPVAAFIGQEMIGSGKIVEITDFAVKIGDEFYMCEACTFKYAV